MGEGQNLPTSPVSVLERTQTKDIDGRLRLQTTDSEQRLGLKTQTDDNSQEVISYFELLSTLRHLTQRGKGSIDDGGSCGYLHRVCRLTKRCDCSRDMAWARNHKSWQISKSRGKQKTPSVLKIFCFRKKSGGPPSTTSLIISCSEPEPNSNLADSGRLRNSMFELLCRGESDGRKQFRF